MLLQVQKEKEKVCTQKVKQVSYNQVETIKNPTKDKVNNPTL